MCMCVVCVTVCVSVCVLRTVSRDKILHFTNTFIIFVVIITVHHSQTHNINT